MQRILSLIILSIIAVTPVLIYAQPNYPGANYFSYQCEVGGIRFYAQNTAVIYANYERLIQGLNSARTSGRNQLIAATSDIGLWALRSNEFQIHRHNDSEGTKMIWSATICQPATPTPTTPIVTGQAFASAQSGVNGRATAYSIVTASGDVVAYVQTQGNASATAYAQSFISPPTTGNQSVYVVQSGDTLYSIARRYNTTVAVLVRLNNIANPDRIAVGQRIILP